MELLNENISHDDLKKYIKELYNYIAKELNIDVPPRIFLRRDKNNAEDIFGKTGGYDPENEEIHLYITDRHPKDVLRSLAHELVHHMQKLQGLDKKVNIDLINQDEAYAQHDEGLREMERQAFEEGNMLFRAWTDGKKMERNNTMTEMKKSDITAAHKKAKEMMPSMKKQYGSEEGERIAYATATKQQLKKEMEMPEQSELEELKNKKKADLNKDGKISSYEKKRGEAIEKSMAKQMKEEKDGAPFEGGKEVEKPSGKHKAKKLAKKGLSQVQKDAEEQAKKDAAHKYKKDESIEEQSDFESKEQPMRENKEVQYPYPQLFEQKPRLMQDAFNKKENLVYQELIRRFIKK